MLRLRVFAGLALEGGGPVQGAATQRRPLALLAYLAVAGDRAVARDALLAILWPESDLERARGALKQTVYALRRDTGEDALVLGTNELQLNGSVVTSDVQRFEHALAAGALEDAVAQYGGPFLESVHLKGSDEFERWTERERRRLSDAYRSALQTLARAATNAKDVLGAVAWTRRLVELEPLSPRFAREYMEALVAADDREAAVKHAAVYGALVRTELETEPDSAFLSFAAELNRPVAALRAATGADQTEPPSADVAGSTPRRLGGQNRVTLRRASAVLAVCIAALGIGGILTKATLHAVAHSTGVEQRLVVVVLPFRPSRPSTDDSRLGLVAQDAIASDLARLGRLDVRAARINPPTPAVENGWSIQGSIIHEGSTRELLVSIRDLRDSTVVALPVIRVPDQDPLVALDTLRVRITGAIASLTDQQFLPAPPRTALPPSYAAYSKFIAGMDAYHNDQLRTAVEMLRSAVGSDTAYTTPLVWLARMYRDLGECDSTLIIGRALGGHDLSPFDHAYLDMLVSRCTGDEGRYERAARAVLRAAPGSAFGIASVVGAEINLNRMHAADSAIREGPLPISSNVEWFFHVTYHALGQYDRELASARIAMSSGDGAQLDMRRHAIGALAAMGRIRELNAIIDSASATIASEEDDNPGELIRVAATELTMHGNGTIAVSYFHRAADWYRHSEAWDRRNRTFLFWDARALREDGDVAAARLLLDSLLVRTTSSRELEDIRGEFGLIEAQSGNVEAARTQDRWLAQQTGRLTLANRLLLRAKIAVALANNDLAMRCLRDAVSAGGARWAIVSIDDAIHQIPEFSALISREDFKRLMLSN